MGNYPKTLMDLEAQFSTEEYCREYLFQLRWPNGFVCTTCGHTKAWKMKSGLFRCSKCKRKVSITAGTIFQDTRKPLCLCFRAICWVVCQKNGANALGLKSILGLGSYEAACTWLHKLRRSMVGLDVIVCLVGLKWMKLMWEERKKECEDGKLKRRHWLLSPHKRMDEVLEGSVCDEFLMHLQTAWKVLYKIVSNRGA